MKETESGISPLRFVMLSRQMRNLIRAQELEICADYHLEREITFDVQKAIYLNDPTLYIL